MAKTTVDELVRSARSDALFDEAYRSAQATIRRAIGKALFDVRKGRNLTQAELADRAGWQGRDVARIERGDPQLITALMGLESFARAADTTAILLFVDRDSAHVRAQVSLGDQPPPTVNLPLP